MGDSNRDASILTKLANKKNSPKHLNRRPNPHCRLELLRRCLHNPYKHCYFFMGVGVINQNHCSFLVVPHAVR